MKNGYLITGVRFKLLHKLIGRNQCTFTPKVIFRYLILLQNAFWSSFFARRDKRLWGEAISKYPLPENPIFIVGHWRTGSTYLHQLMNLDEQLSAPTLYQTALPEGFITARPYYAPIMKQFIGKNRPFDNIKAGIDEPQECEFALFRITGDSPLERVLFPENKKYFLLQKDVEFNHTDERGSSWEKALKAYYTKLSWFSKKRLVLKNPFHSMRIATLHRIFPKACFIHIYRNPLQVVPSTIRMWTVVGSQNAMNNNWGAPLVDEVSSFYDTMLKEINGQFNQLPASQVTSIKYEELVANPTETLQRAYASLGMEFSPTFAARLEKYLTDNRNYEKNSYMLSDQDKECIQNILKNTLPEYFPNN